MIDITKLHARLVAMGTIEADTPATWDAVRPAVYGIQHAAGLQLKQPIFAGDLPVEVTDGVDLEADSEGRSTSAFDAVKVDAKAESEAKAKADAEAKAKADAEAAEEAQRQADADAKAKEEADAQAALDAEAKATEEAAVAKAKEEADAKAASEAQAKAAANTQRK